MFLNGGTGGQSPHLPPRHSLGQPGSLNRRDKRTSFGLGLCLCPILILGPVRLRLVVRSLLCHRHPCPTVGSAKHPPEQSGSATVCEVQREGINRDGWHVACLPRARRLQRP